MKPKRLGKDYSAAEIRTIRRCARSKMSARVCAAKLGRTRGAVAFKAMVLGVSFRAINQPRGVQRKANRTKRRAARAAA